MDRDSSAASTVRFAGCLPLLQTLMVGSNVLTPPHYTTSTARRRDTSECTCCSEDAGVRDCPKCVKTLAAGGQQCTASLPIHTHVSCTPWCLLMLLERGRALRSSERTPMQFLVSAAPHTSCPPKRGRRRRCGDDKDTGGGGRGRGGRDGRPFHWAAAAGQVEAVRALAALQANIEAADAGGMRPLHKAAMEGHVEAVKTLVELQADVEAEAASLDGIQRTCGGRKRVAGAGGQRACHGRPRRHPASSRQQCRHSEVTAGAVLHPRNHGGVTPLFQAVREGHASAVTALVQAGASRDASDFVWWTGLFVEAVGRGTEAVTTLVAASGELERRLEETGHFARSPVQLAELHTTAARREELRSALAEA
jgi:hypothetical protein